MYLVITGTIPLPWEKNAYIHLTDLYGNDIYIPTTTVFSLAFSLFSMIKAIVYFNIARIHVGVSNIFHSRIFSIMKILKNLNLFHLSVWISPVKIIGDCQ